MSAPRFDQAKPFITLAIVAVVWLVVPTAVKRVMRAGFFEMQAPVELAASHVRDLQDFWALKTRSKDQLIEAGRELIQLNNAYEVRLQQDANLRDQISGLNQLLNLPTPDGYRAEPARVVLRQFSSWWQRLVIRKGRDYGITLGSPVIYSGGLVGRVVEVHAYTSVVELVSSPGMRVAASLEGDTRPIAYEGVANPPLAPARGEAEYVPLDVIVTPDAPRPLVTSGLGGIYPAGLAIGKLVKLEPGVDGLFASGEVRLDPSLSTLTEVTVLVPEHPAGGD